MTHPLPAPFVVIATQNPVEHEGTYRLPEAQLDRFLLKLSVGYPTPEEEVRMLGRLQGEHPIGALRAVTTPAALLDAQEAVRRVFVSEPVRAYVAGLSAATRTHPWSRWAAGRAPAWVCRARRRRSRGSRDARSSRRTTCSAPRRASWRTA